MARPVEVADGVYRFGDDVVNFYAAVDGGRLTVIDAGYPGFAERFVADLAALGHTPGDVDALVLTHFDDDHTGLAPLLQEAGAQVLIHEADAETLVKPSATRGERNPLRVLGRAWHPSLRRIIVHAIRNGGAKPTKVQGAATFADGDVVDVPGRPRAVHTPGHTFGHCALLIGDRGVLLAGDALCTHPWITRGREIRTMPHFINEDHAQAVASLDVIERLDAAVVLCGHGDPWTRGAAEAARAARTA